MKRDQSESHRSRRSAVRKTRAPPQIGDEW